MRPYPNDLNLLLSSKGGIHLTVYFKNSNHIDQLKQQIREVITRTSKWLDPVMSIDEKHRFLEYFYILLIDPTPLLKFRHNFGVFCTKNIFKIYSIPMELDFSCQVASTFHVKPILKFLQTNTSETIREMVREISHENISYSQNIFQVCRAAVEGRIKKLVIAEDWSIFGKIDYSTGDLIIHPTDLNHEDDDLLDDLAQIVLAHFGQVIVIPAKDIPYGQPLFATLKEDDSMRGMLA